MNRHTRFKPLLRLFTFACVAVGIASHAQEHNKTSESKAEPQLAMLFEYFEVDHRVANKLIREYSPKAANAKGLRDKLAAMVQGGEATLAETVWLRSRSGQRAKSESIRETIYPTEYDPPEIPNTLGVIPNPMKVKAGEKANAQPVVPPLSVAGSSGNPEILMTSATPTAFEARNVGTTVEVDPVLEEGGKLATISMAPEMISFEGLDFYIKPESKNVAWGTDHIAMARFYAMKTSLQLKAQPGNYNLFGLFTPPNKPKRKIIGLLKMDVIFAN